MYASLCVDSSVSLDQILIQLRDIESDWRNLGQAVHVERLDEIAEFVSCMDIICNTIL